MIKRLRRYRRRASFYFDVRKIKNGFLVDLGFTEIYCKTAKEVLKLIQQKISKKR